MSELIQIETITAKDVFVEGGLDPYINKVKAAVNDLKFDMNNPLDRAECKSMAHKVARSKTALDDLGKSLVEDIKKEAKVKQDIDVMSICFR